MRKFFVCLFIFSSGLFLFSTKAQAHFLQTDGSIGAVLHVSPNDEPVVNEQANFFFEFNDKDNKFKADNCTCTISIIEAGKQIASQSLFQNNTNPGLTNASFSFTFPERDLYEVKVTGQPLTPNAFQPFTLSWNFRLDREVNGISTTAQPSFFATHMTVFIILGIFIFTSFFYIVTRITSKKAQHKKGGEMKDDKEDLGNFY